MIEQSVYNILSTKKYIFWDFDGVIKESVEVKSDAFENLFKSFGDEVAKKVRNHHEENGCVSRFDKLPLYLEWAGQDLSPSLIEDYSERFSKLVKQNVINSDWVKGVLDFIHIHSKKQTFFLVTATPQSEIEEILDTLQLKKFFCRVIGAPVSKDKAINQMLSEFSIKPEKALMIGDSSSDYDAALANQVPFILRRTNLNDSLQKRISCPMVNNFCDE